MNDIRRYLDILTEMFDKPLRWKWDAPMPELRYASFVSGEDRYAARFQYHRDDDYWSFNFRNNGSIATTNSGNEFAVFATVLDILQTFLKSEHPDRLRFSAVKSDGRAALYRKMIRRTLPSLTKLGYAVEPQTVPRGQENDDKAWLGIVRTDLNS